MNLGNCGKSKVSFSELNLSLRDMENSHEFLFLKGKAVSESLVQHQKHFPESTLEGWGKKKKLRHICKSN